MKRVYLSGQNNFGNRGCEALVRSTLQLLKAEFGPVEVLVPSYRPDLDAKQWPDAEREGCRFVRAMPYPTSLKIWGRIRRYAPWITNIYFPDFPLPSDIAADIASCTALLVIGGDNITLDYGVESLIWHIRFAQHAQRMGKCVMVWGASIGPFSVERNVEKFAATFLGSVDCITVRETISADYLAKLRVNERTSLVADGAFVMTPEPVDIQPFLPTTISGKVLGFNISPLIQKFRPPGEPRRVLQQEVAGFLTEILETTDVSIVLIPHVDPLDGASENSDSHYMREILNLIGSPHTRVSLLPSHLNAPQLKYAISQCNYFMGARTHATIGALSALVPTISIAYSIKAKGINRDLFGNEEWVLETNLVSQKSLALAFQKLVSQSSAIRTTLAERIPQWRLRSQISSTLLKEQLLRKSPNQ